jgi:hypothetical protein
MKYIIALTLLTHCISLQAQDLKLMDYLGADKNRLINAIQNSPNFTNIEVVNNDTLYSIYKETIGVKFIFLQDKVFIQEIIYPRDMSNTVMKYLMNMVVIEPRESYVNFNVDPPTFHKVIWEEDYLILTLYE